MELNGISAKINKKELVNSINNSFTNRQKVDIAKGMSDFHGAIDMDYIESLLVMAAKTRLKSIKKDIALYNRNRDYFKALKTIVSIKTAE